MSLQTHLSHLKGLGVVLLMAGVLYLIWSQYSDFLTQGSRPSEAVIKLKSMEKKGVPDFSVKDVNGDEISLSRFKDKIVILNFWASWCEPCVDEFPSMIQLVEHFNGDIILVAVSADYTLEDMKSFLRAFKVTDPHIKVVWDKGKVIPEKYGTEILPESYILGKDNRLVRKITGIDRWYTPEAITFFEDLLQREWAK